MSQDRHQHAATTVIQDPSNDDRKAYFADCEQDESKPDADEAIIGVGACNGPKEEGNVPQAPERPEDEGSDQRTVYPLQTGQRETTPPTFFQQRTTRRNEEDEDKRTQVERYKAPIRSDELSKDPWHDRHRQKYQNRNADHGHQVPLHADSPAHIAAQQAKHSGLS